MRYILSIIKPNTYYLLKEEESYLGLEEVSSSDVL